MTIMILCFTGAITLFWVTFVQRVLETPHTPTKK